MKFKLLLIGLSLFSSFSYSKVNPTLSINEDPVCSIFADAYGEQLAAGKTPSFGLHQKLVKEISDQGPGEWGWFKINPQEPLSTPMEFIPRIKHQDIVWQKWQPALGLKYGFHGRGNVRYAMGYGVLIGSIKPAPDKTIVVETFSSRRLNADELVVSIIEDADLDKALASMRDEDIIKSRSPIIQGYYPINMGQVVISYSNDYAFKNIFQYKNNFYTADKNGVYKLEEYETRTVCEIGNGLSLKSPQLTKFEDVANKRLLTKAKYPGYYGLFYSANRQLTNGFKEAIEKPMLIKVNKDGTCFKDKKVDLCGRNRIVDNILSELASTDPWSYREVQAIREHAKSAKYVLSQFYIKQLNITETIAKAKANQAVYNFLAKMVGFHPAVRYYSHKFKNTSKVKEIDLYTLDDPAGSIPNNQIVKTELMWAAHFNDYDAIQRLLNKAENSDKISFVNAVTSSSNSSIERLNRSALTYAVENATIPVIKALISAGADLEIKDSQGHRLDYYLDKNNLINVSLEEITIMPLEQIKPSFDCKLASTVQEKAICANKGLAVYDSQMAQLYKKVKNELNNSDIKRLQRSWLKELRKTCSMPDSTALYSCMKSKYRTRIQYLNNLLTIEH